MQHPWTNTAQGPSVLGWYKAPQESSCQASTSWDTLAAGAGCAQEAAGTWQPTITHADQCPRRAHAPSICYSLNVLCINHHTISCTSYLHIFSLWSPRCARGCTAHPTSLHSPSGEGAFLLSRRGARPWHSCGGSATSKALCCAPQSQPRLGRETKKPGTAGKS